MVLSRDLRDGYNKVHVPTSYPEGDVKSSSVNWEQRLIKWLRAPANASENDGLHREESWLRRFLIWQSRLDQKLVKGYLSSFAVAMFLLLGRYSRRRRAPILSQKDSRTYHSASEAPISLLYKTATNGEIESALLSGSTSGGAMVYYILKNSADWKKSLIPTSLNSRELIETLSRTCDNVSALPESVSSRLAAPVLSALPFIYLFFLYRVLKQTLGVGGKDDLKVMDQKATSITFADVAGMPQVIAEVGEVARYLMHPGLYAAIGARPPRAILLHGPPGSGKTLLAQALAGQANVPFFACSASEFVEVYVGRGAARVRSLFSKARQAALRHRNQSRGGFLSTILPWSAPYSYSRQLAKPAAAILFFDELDALAKSRLTVASNDEREQTLNQLLTELDGFGTRQLDDQMATIIVIAATNRADVLDPAILRRFDRQIHVPYPITSRERKEILEVHARRVNCCGAIDWDRVASESRTGGCSGSDLHNIVNEAALLAVREGSSVIEQEHVDHAARRIQQMKWKQDHPGQTFITPGSPGIT